MNWLRKLLGLCNHQWVILSSSRVFEFESDSRPIGENIILQCKHCGDIKTKKTY